MWGVSLLYDIVGQFELHVCSFCSTCGKHVVWWYKYGVGDVLVWCMCALHVLETSGVGGC